MSTKESNLTTITSADFAGADKIRVLDGSTSRNITLTEFIAAFNAEEGTGTYVDTTGDTMSGNLSLEVSASPKLTVKSTSSGNATVSITSVPGASAILNLGDTSDENIGNITYDNINNKLIVTVNTSEAFTVDNALLFTTNGDNSLGGDTNVWGALTVSGATDLNGALTCKAITVDASSALDMGANKLTNLANNTAAQDAVTQNYLESTFYSSSTFTPTLTDGANSANESTSSATGYYTKIDELVFFSATFNVSGSVTLSGAAYIGGIPFDAAGQSNTVAIGTAGNLTITAGQSVTGTVSDDPNNAGQARVPLYLWDHTSGTTQLLFSEIGGTNFYITVSGWFKTV